VLFGCSAIVEWKDPPNQCGDGVLDSWEACDGTQFGDQSCESNGFSGGSLTCDDGCQIWFDGCHQNGSCGNGVWEHPAEQCDYPEMGQESCEFHGYTGGLIQCNGDCTYDLSGCTNANCGDGYCDLLNCEDNNSCSQDCDASCDNEVCEIGRGETAVNCESECAWQWVAAGSEFTCAARKDASIWCWGSNDYGKLGDNTESDSNYPVRTANLDNSGMVTAGRDHACALDSDRNVWCWGRNDMGQLGYGNFSNRLQPVLIGGFPDIELISAGGENTCALQQGGWVWCWGTNGRGQLGIALANPGETCGGSDPCTDTPLQVAELVEAHYIALGPTDPDWGHACALQYGDAWCWGRNDVYQNGHAPPVDDASPVQVTTGGGLSQIVAGQGFTCAAQTAGVLCWGDNEHGQLGNGTGNGDATWIPQQVVGFNESLKTLSAGHGHTCASSDNGGAWCWGVNGFGRLGNGTTTNQIMAVPVLDLPGNVEQISAGATHTCALVSITERLEDRLELYCWGENTRGQLGDGTNEERHQPVQVIDLPGPPPQ